MVTITNLDARGIWDSIQSENSHLGEENQIKEEEGEVMASLDQGLKSIKILR
jgi:hypothetical protein